MTITVIDDFVGVNGAAISAAKWNRQYEASSSGFIQDNKGRVRFVSTVADNYRKASLESIATYGRGRYRVDIQLGRTSAGGQINRVALGFCANNPYDAAYTYLPIDGYAFEIDTGGGAIQLWKIQGEQARDLAGAANGNLPLASGTVPGFVIGDVIHLEAEPSSTGVAVRVWRNIEARPAVATLTTTDVAFLGGEVKLGFMGHGPDTDVHGDVSALTYDDLVTAGTTANAGPDQAVAPSATVVLVGTPPVGAGSAAGAWSQVSGPAQTLGAPVTNATDTRVSFVAANGTAVAVACVFRYTVA